MKKLVTATVLLLAVNGAWAQCKEGWPENKVKAEEQQALYTDAMKQGNYRGAVPGLQWFLTNAPKWSTNLYIHGAEVYNKLALAEKDPVKKQVLVDSLMWFYDERIKNCGDEVNVLNRKAIQAAVFNGQNKGKTDEVLKLFDRVFEISGNNVSDNNLDNYFKIVYANFALLKNLTEEQILQRYDKLMEVIDQKIKTAQQAAKSVDVDKLKKIKSGVDDLLIKMVKVDCEFVKKNLEPKFRQNPTDPGLSKKIFGFMLQGKCIDDPLWLEAGEILSQTEKDFGLLKALGVKHLINGNSKRAEELIKEAATLAKEPADKAEVLSILGKIEAKKGNNAGARDLFRQALAADPSFKEAYEQIGILYANSASECAKKESQAQDRLVYIAAYEMYAKAGNSQLMSNAKEQFPSREDIFLIDWKVGETKSTGCWIGETVTLRTRD